MALKIVKTSFGTIEGEEYTGAYKGISVFRGVPYAAPPVGELRFRPPADPESWEGVRDCTKFAPAAIQTPLADRHAHEFYFNGFPPMSEDCLYLNICSGASGPGEGRPVYLWLHGGGQTNCYAYEPQFDPRELARKGIVVVTVGHRLNLFGYLALPQLDAEQGRSGNYGFMDLVKALDWITENIGAFGGDPENITAGGQSGGCTKALMLALSPAGRDRIRRVISESGLKWMIPLMTRAKAFEVGQNYLRHVGLPEDITPGELREIPADKLYSRTATRAITPGDMLRDDCLICADTFYEMLEGFEGTLDFLNVCNWGETDLLSDSRAALGSFPVRGYVKEIRTAQDFYKHFKNLLGPLYERYGFEELIKVTDEDAWREAHRLGIYGLAGSEGMNVSRSLMLNRLFGKYLKGKAPQAKVYNCLWSYTLPLEGADVGSSRDCKVSLAWHSTELWFAFNSLKPGLPPDRPWSEEDFSMGRTMSTYWANFMKTGDPNGDGLPFWPECGDSYGWLNAGRPIMAHEGLEGRLDKLIKDFVCREYHLGL